MAGRVFLTLVSDDLPGTKGWYVEMFGLKVAFDSDWFVQLTSSLEGAELCLMRRDHELVPEGVGDRFAGGMVTITVEDVELVHELAQARGEEVVEEPKDLFYGQRRMVLRGPEGVLVDVSSRCEPDAAWLASLG